jgi:queuosine precursor transporter
MASHKLQVRWAVRGSVARVVMVHQVYARDSSFGFYDGARASRSLGFFWLRAYNRAVKENTAPKTFRYFDLILAAFAVILVVSNIASTKLATVTINTWKPVFDGGTFLFPLTYIFGDVLTEVYGYARAKRVIWFAMGANLASSLIFALIGLLPTDPTSPTKGAFETVLGFYPQIVFASLTAFFVGEFLNAYVLAKLKVMTGGKFLWMRTIGSTLIGEGIDTLTFSWIAFGIGTITLSGFGFRIDTTTAIPPNILWGIIGFNYVYKVALEVILTPVTYAVVGFLKRAENVDVYDRKTNFNPFALREKISA